MNERHWKPAHKALLSQRFDLDVYHANFTIQELNDLERCGHWLEALACGALRPETDKQRDFVDAVAGKKPPQTYWESLWLKYKANRIEWHPKMGDGGPGVTEDKPR